MFWQPNRWLSTTFNCILIRFESLMIPVSRERVTQARVCSFKNARFPIFVLICWPTWLPTRHASPSLFSESRFCMSHAPAHMDQQLNVDVFYSNGRLEDFFLLL